MDKQRKRKESVAAHLKGKGNNKINKNKTDFLFKVVCKSKERVATHLTEKGNHDINQN